MSYRGITGFKVKNDFKFVSHLDTVKMFERLLRKYNVSLIYSAGFSPHPKISIPVPRPVGVESRAEYVEFLYEDGDIEFFKDVFDSNLIEVFYIKQYFLNTPSLSKRIKNIDYFFSDFDYEKINSEILKNFRGINNWKFLDNIFKISTGRDFSLSKFSREYCFKKVKRKVNIKKIDD
ncbi:MAG: TIGR03936 family radical SAM-associated protein [Candidatus Muiribacteriota bacterium]